MTADRPATEPRRPARNDDERCVVQDCPNRHEWFYGPGLYLCDPHVKAIEAEAAQVAAPRAEGPPTAWELGVPEVVSNGGTLCVDCGFPARLVHSFPGGKEPAGYKSHPALAAPRAEGLDACPVCGGCDAEDKLLTVFNDREEACRLLVGMLDAFDERWTGDKPPPPIYYRAQAFLDRMLPARLSRPSDERDHE